MFGAGLAPIAALTPARAITGPIQLLNVQGASILWVQPEAQGSFAFYILNGLRFTANSGKRTTWAAAGKVLDCAASCRSYDLRWRRIPDDAFSIGTTLLTARLRYRDGRGIENGSWSGVAVLPAPALAGAALPCGVPTSPTGTQNGRALLASVTRNTQAVATVDGHHYTTAINHTDGIAALFDDVVVGASGNSSPLVALGCS